LRGPGQLGEFLLREAVRATVVADLLGDESEEPALIRLDVSESFP